MQQLIIHNTKNYEKFKPQSRLCRSPSLPYTYHCRLTNKFHSSNPREPDARARGRGCSDGRSQKDTSADGARENNSIQLSLIRTRARRARRKFERLIGIYSFVSASEEVRPSSTINPRERDSCLLLRVERGLVKY